MNSEYSESDKTIPHSTRNRLIYEESLVTFNVQNYTFVKWFYKKLQNFQIRFIIIIIL